MKKFVLLASLLALNINLNAAAPIPSRMISTVQQTDIAPASSNLATTLTWLNDNWHTNINPDVVYPSYAQTTSMIGQAAMPGTNIAGATYTSSNKTWTLDAAYAQTNQYITLVSNVYNTLQSFTNTSVQQYFTILTNGAPMMTDYLNLTSSNTVWNTEGTTNWVGEMVHVVTSWTNNPEENTGGGGELEFDSTNGIVLIPANCLAISYFRGQLKDKSDNLSETTAGRTYVTFEYTGASGTAGIGTLFEADRVDAEDPNDVVTSGDTRFFPPRSTDRELRILSRHLHRTGSGAVAAGSTKDKALQWQILLIKFL